MKPAEILEQCRFLGEEFVLWLWQRGLEDGGTSGKDGDLSACFVEDSIVLASEHGEVHQISLNKGNPAESREAFEALARGMRPVKAKMRILAGDMEWVFTLDAGGLVMSGLKLPPAASKDPVGRIADRLFLLEEGCAHLERRFALFLAYRTKNPSTLEAGLKRWIRAGLAGTPDDSELHAPITGLPVEVGLKLRGFVQGIAESLGDGSSMTVEVGGASATLHGTGKGPATARTGNP